MRRRTRKDPDLLDVLELVAEPLERAGLRYMVVGALAVTAHGAPRMTHDVDIRVDVTGTTQAHVRDVLAKTRLPVEGPDRNEFGMHFAVLHPLIPIEVYLSGDHPYTRTEHERAVIRRMGNREIPVMSAEDLILRKLHNLTVRRSSHDLLDLQSVMLARWEELDWGYLRENARYFRSRKRLDDLADEVERMRAEG